MKSGKKPLCLKLWHGTSKTNPVDVYTKDGFNIAYSEDRCMWGRGIYFAEDSKYSCPSYSYKVPNTSNTYEIFYSLVLIGDFIDLKGNSDNSLKTPPLKSGS